jgi:hypothetical protein
MEARMREPLTPGDCDLRGMPFMPVDLVRLFDSDLYALSTGDQFKAAFTLWGKAFLQVPAGSLPTDERILAHLSGAGANWRKVRDVALRGWVRCSDGRLYHPVVAEKARAAWDARQAQRARTEAARAKLSAQRSGRDGEDTPPVPAAVTASVTGYAKGSKGEGQVEAPSSSLRSDEGPPAPPPAAVAPLLHDVRTALWIEGLSRLRRLTGKGDRAARSLLGKLLSRAGDDCSLLQAVLMQAEIDRPGDPEAWILACIDARLGRRVSAAPRRGRDTSWLDRSIFDDNKDAPRGPIIDMAAEG